MSTVQDIILSKPHLLWHVKDPSKLSEEAVLEAVLNYGDWDDVKNFIKIKGVKQTAKLFEKTNDKLRSNYLSAVGHYFIRFFKKYA